MATGAEHLAEVTQSHGRLLRGGRLQSSTVTSEFLKPLKTVSCGNGLRSSTKGMRICATSREFRGPAHMGRRSNSHFLRVPYAASADVGLSRAHEQSKERLRFAVRRLPFL